MTDGTPEDPFSAEEMNELLGKFFSTDKPVLHADDPDLDRISRAAWNVLSVTNTNPVSIFRVGSVPSRLETDDDGGPVIRPLTVERLRQEMSVRAVWYKGLGHHELFGRLIGLTPGDDEWGELHKKNSNARPPRDVVQNMLAMPDISHVSRASAPDSNESRRDPRRVLAAFLHALGTCCVATPARAPLGPVPGGTG